MFDKNKIAIIIPAYEPDNKMYQLIKELIQRNFNNILVIDDGSSSNSDSVFNNVSTFKQVNIVKHAVNQGKGRALKTGFNTIINEYPYIVGAITVDADGQHLPKDIESCAEALYNNIDSLVLGVRNFDDEKVPTRSRFGNKVTIQVLNLLVGIKISDTQTGLRGLSTQNMKRFMQVLGENYEYEMNMLIETKEWKINIVEVPISTVYIEENASSHFNPILDSAKIYKVFLKFLTSSFSSSLLDIILFTILVAVLNDVFPNTYILMSTVLARIVSMFFNYNLNAKRVFKIDDKNNSTFYRYFLLAILQMFASAFLVLSISNTFLANETIVKLVVDLFLFFISFIIQRELVFKEKEIG